jgi:hypothetical protein
MRASLPEITQTASTAGPNARNQPLKSRDLASQGDQIAVSAQPNALIRCSER